MSNIQDPETDMASETATLHSQNDVPKDALSEKFQHDPEKAMNGDSEPAMAEGEASPSAPPKNPWMDPASYPDGGPRAWLTVAGGMCALFVSFGMFSFPF